MKNTLKNSIVLTGICLFFASCGGPEGKTGAKEAGQQEEKTEEKEALVTAPTKPENITFVEQDFEGIGKISVPSGKDWVKDGNEISNEKLAMTIVIQAQDGDFTQQTKEFTDSYNEINKRDAPKYELVKEQTGDVGGVNTVRVVGKFNNGDQYSTRDYLFYTPEKVVMYMSRADSKNQASLDQITDYVAASFKKK